MEGQNESYQVPQSQVRWSEEELDAANPLAANGTWPRVDLVPREEADWEEDALMDEDSDSDSSEFDLEGYFERHDIPSPNRIHICRSYANMLSALAKAKRRRPNTPPLVIPVNEE